MRRHRPRPRPWSNLTDAEFEALLPFVCNTGAGRPVHDLRGKLDAIFRIATTSLPWSRVSTDHGPTATLHRLFRRWAHAGVWSRLLKESARRRAPRAIRRMQSWIAAVFRRCHRLLGLAAVVLARRLRIHRALPGPSWYFPDPDLSETLMAVLADAAKRPAGDSRAAELTRLTLRLLRNTTRRRPVPRCLVPVG
ncbi:transposase [Neoroseomonas rubea]|uniref:transposase n=1 Tax=Neoroseomonas rubea TaxID=2748666 RepID=UPI0018DF0F28|nr:transposase [Roseomonas rubea]